MRRSLLALLTAPLVAASLAAGASGASLAPPEGGSTGSGGSGGTGVKAITVVRLHVGYTTPVENFNESFDGGLGLGFNLAHGVTRSILLSLGAAYHHFSGDGNGVDATIVPVTFNAEGLLPSSGDIHPYLGCGLGFYNISLDSDVIVRPPGGTESESIHETNLGVNFGAGIASKSGERGLWGVGLRYHHTFEGELFNDLDFVTFQASYGFFL
ncbi:MAG TPA: outer membrane beta-barrel protein [Candidatus Eisenbacteria bacterium]|nr:outer membrane beta-barrel protein [Candidatus Eisenbacteria bacterium]